MGGTFVNPVGDLLIGDPFILRWRGLFYLYGTNDGPPLAGGMAVPAYRSADMVAWEPLGGVLAADDPGADHWAPEVLAFGGRFYMVVSYGDVDHRGHALWVAAADRPEGPFRLKKRVSAGGEKFSIDGAYLLDDDGRLYLYRCLDFVDEAPPHGTGIVVQRMADPWSPLGEPATVLRAHAPWHLFGRDRAMGLYGGRVYPEWTTIEGPAPVKRNGRYHCGYSGGNYAGAYGTGEAVADDPMGPYADARGAAGPIFGTAPGLVEGPGHFSVVRPDGVRDWIALHGRRPGAPGRRLWLCPAEWADGGLHVAPPTIEPQPAPALPRYLVLGDKIPWGWTTAADGSRWEAGAGGIRQHATGVEAAIWREEPLPAGGWVAEVYLRLPEPSPDGRAGLAIGGASGELRVEAGAEVIRVVGADGSTAVGRWPSLGEARGDPAAYRPIEVRARGVVAEVRADGVVVASGVAVPVGASRVGLIARGAAEFDAASVSDL